MELMYLKDQLEFGLDWLLALRVAVFRRIGVEDWPCEPWMLDMGKAWSVRGLIELDAGKGFMYLADSYW